MNSLFNFIVLKRVARRRVQINYKVKKSFAKELLQFFLSIDGNWRWYIYLRRRKEKIKNTVYKPIDVDDIEEGDDG